MSHVSQDAAQRSFMNDGFFSHSPISVQNLQLPVWSRSTHGGASAA
eukprot:CAMPEP_0181183548 /NCGR_PEP_ID=MMETSP1096-20121128/8485_1 /TAXON_ID=156174 ORGANISM="Chrysochromulina ericina, Strain CCMP281" /NCGR_SAMPLE_ID=MMETSP1096 /ASSEMBLY_ACC=CAM_ASM_000453 /LENGTH=45 /DNA_ID= /DNA_START= /DNA_END= /DNA_ORIENTATION=